MTRTFDKFFIDDRTMKCMGDFLIESLEKGKEIESQGIKFYTDAANSIEDPNGKSTLSFLASEEERHLGFIRKLINSVSKGADISQMIQKNGPVIFPQKEEFQKRIAAGDGDKRVLEEAIFVEERSIEFYSDCLSGTSGAERSIFKALVEEEKRHRAWLDFMKEGMDVHGYWYGLEDYFALDG